MCLLARRACKRVIFGRCRTIVLQGLYSVERSMLWYLNSLYYRPGGQNRKWRPHADLLSHLGLDFKLFDFCRAPYFLIVGHHTQKKHTILYVLHLNTQNPQPILPSATQSVVCRNENLRFRLWFFHSLHTFFMRCHSKNQSWVWIQAPMGAPKSVLTTRFII